MSGAGPGRREVAHRLFAAEYDDATLEYAESDEERAPNYVVTPSGTRVNRLFVVGVLTAVEQVNEDTIRARIADPTGAYVIYAGQYQPDELAALQSMESPSFVAVTGKANTFSPEGSDRVLTSVRPESVTEVDAETRDRWVVATAEHTLARIQTAADALQREERGEELRAALLREGVEPGFAEGIARAIDHYDTTADYLDALATLASQALEVVAGERSEVEALELDPDEGDGTVSAGDLTDLLPDDRQSATEAAEDVDPEALLESEASGAGEPAAESEDDAGETAVSTADDGEGDEDAGGSDEAEPETDIESDAEEPVTDERSVEATASDAEEAAEADVETDDGPEPETDESAVEETAADAEAASDTEESGEAAAEESEPAESEADDAADEMYEVDEAEREEIEEEYGVEFQSGTEVDPAGEAGIETEEPPADEDDDLEEESADEPETTEEDDSADEAEAEEDAEETDASEDADEDEADADEDDESDEDVDLEGVLLEEMDALDEGEGADREALQEAVAEATGADADAIDDAIDDLLMSGQCYEPSEGTLKPI